MEDYRAQKAVLDGELDRLRQIHAAAAAQSERVRKEEQAKGARTELARKLTGNNGLTAELADALIDRVYVYPENHVEVIWKMRDFCAA